MGIIWGLWWLVHYTFFSHATSNFYPQECRVLPTPQSGPTDIAPRFLSSNRQPVFRDDRLQDLAFKQVSGAAGDPGLCGEEADKYSEPFTQQDLGSEHSLHSPKSFDKVNLGKPFQTHPSSNSNSHRSIGSHSRLSDRPRDRALVSEKAESVGSAKSRNREQGKLVSVVQSGSEGSDKGQIWSVGSVGRLSDNESFWWTHQKIPFLCVHSAFSSKCLWLCTVLKCPFTGFEVCL